MRLLVFLGSGVSVPSGLPMAQGLMHRIIHDAYHLDENRRFRTGPAAQGQTKGIDELIRIRRLIRLLVNHDNADRKRIGLARRGARYVASGAIYRRATTYEDVYALCQQIDDWMHGLSDNALTTPLVELIERKAGTIVAGRGRQRRIVEIGQLAHSARFFIQAVVADALQTTRTDGLDLLLAFVAAPEIAQVNIVTLNHDTLVEQLLARTGIPVVDGFGEPDGDVRWYDDAHFDVPEAPVKVIKLHGSVDWYRFYRDGHPTPAILNRGNVSTAVDRAGTTLKPEMLTPWFLTGGEKEAWYQHDIYADLHFRFHELLRCCNRMVMSGYGWGDTGISNQVDRWLDQRPSNRLILLHEHPEEIVKRSPIIGRSYDDLVERGQLIPIRTWMCNTSLEAVRPLLQETN